MMSVKTMGLKFSKKYILFLMKMILLSLKGNLEIFNFQYFSLFKKIRWIQFRRLHKNLDILKFECRNFSNLSFFKTLKETLATKIEQSSFIHLELSNILIQ